MKVMKVIKVFNDFKDLKDFTPLRSRAFARDNGADMRDNRTGVAGSALGRGRNVKWYHGIISLLLARYIYWKVLVLLLKYIAIHSYISRVTKGKCIP